MLSYNPMHLEAQQLSTRIEVCGIHHASPSPGFRPLLCRRRLGHPTTLDPRPPGSPTLATTCIPTSRPAPVNHLPRLWLCLR